MPIAALLPAIIGAGGAIGSSLIGRNGAGSGTASNQQNFGQFQGLLDSLTGKGDQLTHFGKQERHAFRKTLDPAAGYWRDMLGSTDSTKLSSLFAPEINQI